MGEMWRDGCKSGLGRGRGWDIATTQAARNVNVLDPVKVKG